MKLQKLTDIGTLAGEINLMLSPTDENNKYALYIEHFDFTNHDDNTQGANYSHYCSQFIDETSKIFDKFNNIVGQLKSSGYCEVENLCMTSIVNKVVGHKEEKVYTLAQLDELCADNVAFFSKSD